MSIYPERKLNFKRTFLRWISVFTVSFCGIAIALGADPSTDRVPQSGMAIGTNFWNLSYRDAVTWKDVFLPDVDFSTVDNPWNPRFLHEVSQYEVLRFMDFGKVNNSSERRWSDRTRKTDPRPGQERLAYEWMIDLANRTGTDIWICLPAMADQVYSLQLAKLIKANLDPESKVYVEWSNETWNGIFSQKKYAIRQGLDLGLDSNPKIAGAKYHVYRALRLFRQFDAIFDTDSQRVVRVISGQSVNTSLTRIHLAALNDKKINPTGIKVDAYAIAPYFGHQVDGASKDAIERLASHLETVIDDVREQHEIVSSAGMRLIAYEGGQHVTRHADIVNARPEMYTLYTDFLDGVAPYLNVFAHYVHNGQWGAIGSWGAESHVGQPLEEAHKLRAIYDWMKGDRRQNRSRE